MTIFDGLSYAKNGKDSHATIKTIIARIGFLGTVCCKALGAFLPRIALSRKHAAHLVHPQALAAANGIFESEYLGEPQLDKDWRRDVAQCIYIYIYVYIEIYRYIS